jgi:hypothetical protein
VAARNSPFLHTEVEAWGAEVGDSLVRDLLAKDELPPARLTDLLSPQRLSPAHMLKQS